MLTGTGGNGPVLRRSSVINLSRRPAAARGRDDHNEKNRRKSLYGTHVTAS
jgi:hypothetical protein